MDFLSALPGLHWQLSILSKAVHYKNLSGAADHVGISQPQLSRIIAKLEEELGVVLLDRSTKRKSGWTPVAFKIADTYFQSARKLSLSLQELADEDHVSQISIGTLEGLIPLANKLCRELFKIPALHHIELNVYDLNELEEKFTRDEMELCLTSREPGKQKHRFVRNLGYQVLTKMNTSSRLWVQSQYDFATQSGKSKSKLAEKRLVSNSLAVRRHWIDEHEGAGSLPSEVRQKKLGDSDVPVLLLASNVFSPLVWKKIEQFRL